MRQLQQTPSEPFFPKKSLGQCFLAAPEILDEIAELLPLKGKMVLEIGAGDGRLTEELAAKIGKSGKLVAVELDDQLAFSLQQKFASSKNVKILHDDVLDVNFESYPYVFGNLPYYLSTPILLKTLQSNFEHAVFMLQAEFGERLVASPGSKEYSRLTLTLQSKATAEIVDFVPKECFDPIPKVDSVLVHIQPKPEKERFELDHAIVTAAFQHPNQNLRKAFKHSQTTLGEEKVKKLLENAPKRILEKPARQVPIVEFADLSRLA